MSEIDDREQPVPEDAAEADRVEQRTDLDEDEPQDLPVPLPFDANEADVTEQHREVRIDEDDYR